MAFLDGLVQGYHVALITCARAVCVWVCVSVCVRGVHVCVRVHVCVSPLACACVYAMFRGMKSFGFAGIFCPTLPALRYYERYLGDIRDGD